jgi:tape measure domain-containing protein
MANLLGDMIVKIIGDTTALEKSFKDAEEKTKTLGAKIDKEINKVADGFIKVGKGLSLGVTTPLVAMATAAVKSSADMEMLRASFETMLGSAENASTLTKEIQKLGVATPYTAEQLAEAAKTSLSFGISQEKIIPYMRMFSDIAGGNAEKLKSLAVVFGQVSSLGRLQGQDLLQLINVGFNPLNEIAKKTGESMGALRDRMSKGAISAIEVKEAFESATSAGGLFYNGAERASQTLTGLASTLADDVATMGRSFADLFLPQIKNLVKNLSDAAKWVTNLDEPTKNLIVTLGGIAAAAGPIAVGIGLVSKALVALKAANPILLAISVAIPIVVTAIGSLSAAAQKAKKETEDLNSALAFTADLATTQKALDKVSGQLEGLKGQSRELVSVWEEQSLNEQIESLEIQKARLERNSAILSSLQKKREEDAAAEKKATEEAAKAEEEKLKALNRTKTAEEKQIEARKEAAATYDSELKKIKDYRDNVLITVEEAATQTTAATNAYAKALLDAGYSATENSIGGKALAKALADLRAAQIAANDATKESIGLSEELPAVAIQEEIEAEKRAAAWRSVTDSVNENIQAQENMRAVASAVFTQLGADLANNEVSWKSLGTAAINSIGAIVYALGDELGAKAAAQLIEAIAASLNPITAWAAPGMYAAAAQLGVGAAAAWTVGSMLKTVKLAEGGLATGPTMAVVGDNPRYPELVAPLSPEVMGMLADGLMMAFATRSRPAGVTESSVAQSRNVTPYSSAARSVSFAGATIIADDSGLRKLNRQLRRFGLQEDVRVGA